MKAFFSCIVPFLALCVNIQAQTTNTNEAVSLTRQQLRDSLAAASQELSFHPDSLDLRLRKASWNVQLEQWQYARDEYDYVLDRNPQNVAALLIRSRSVMVLRVLTMSVCSPWLQTISRLSLDWLCSTTRIAATRRR